MNGNLNFKQLSYVGKGLKRDFMIFGNKGCYIEDFYWCEY